MSQGRLQLVSLFADSIRKHPDTPNEDYFKVSDARQHFVLSDGATESYDSARWAEIIVKLWGAVNKRSRLRQRLDRLVDRYLDSYDGQTLSWSQEAAFQRGSFASLLSVTQRDGQALVVAIGDSVALLVVDNTLVQSFPYTSSEQFSARPHLLSTIRERNVTEFLTDGFHEFEAREDNGRLHTSWNLTAYDHAFILCMTDALGAWCLDLPSERIGPLLNMRDVGDFESLVAGERLAGSLRRDDSTLLVLEWREAS